MKAGLIAFGMLLLSTPALAGGIVSKHASSVQLTVDAAKSTATRTVSYTHLTLPTNREV